MSLKKFLRFSVIKFNRYLLHKPFIQIFSGRLKGYLWHTASNYDYIVGEYEDPVILDIFLSWFQPDSVFYDVGANIGYYSFLAEQKITSGTIYSFEPMPRNLALFQQHLHLNKDKIKEGLIELHPFAISDFEKEVFFSNDPVAVEGNTYIEMSNKFKNNVDTLKIKCHAIDELVKKGFKPPQVIKIDVEGAEYDVLIGAAGTIQRYKPKILLATHDGHFPGIKDKCIALLQSFGYQLKHTGYFNKHLAGHDDYIAIYGHKD